MESLQKAFKCRIQDYTVERVNVRVNICFYCVGRVKWVNMGGTVYM